MTTLSTSVEKDVSESTFFFIAATLHLLGVASVVYGNLIKIDRPQITNLVLSVLKMMPLVPKTGAQQFGVSGEFAFNNFNTWHVSTQAAVIHQLCWHLLSQIEYPHKGTAPLILRIGESENIILEDEEAKVSIKFSELLERAVDQDLGSMAMMHLLLALQKVRRLGFVGGVKSEDVANIALQALVAAVNVPTSSAEVENGNVDDFLADTVAAQCDVCLPFIATFSMTNKFSMIRLLDFANNDLPNEELRAALQSSFLSILRTALSLLRQEIDDGGLGVNNEHLVLLCKVLDVVILVKTEAGDLRDDTSLNQLTLCVNEIVTCAHSAYQQLVGQEAASQFPNSSINCEKTDKKENREPFICSNIDPYVQALAHFSGMNVGIDGATIQSPTKPANQLEVPSTLLGEDVRIHLGGLIKQLVEVCGWKHTLPSVTYHRVSGLLASLLDTHREVLRVELKKQTQQDNTIKDDHNAADIASMVTSGVQNSFVDRMFRAASPTSSSVFMDSLKSLNTLVLQCGAVGAWVTPLTIEKGLHLVLLHGLFSESIATRSELFSADKLTSLEQQQDSTATSVNVEHTLRVFRRLVDVQSFTAIEHPPVAESPDHLEQLFECIGMLYSTVELDHLPEGTVRVLIFLAMRFKRSTAAVAALRGLLRSNSVGVKESIGNPDESAREIIASTVLHVFTSATNQTTVFKHHEGPTQMSKAKVDLSNDRDVAMFHLLSDAIVLLRTADKQTDALKDLAWTSSTPRFSFYFGDSRVEVDDNDNEEQVFGDHLMDVLASSAVSKPVKVIFGNLFLSLYLDDEKEADLQVLMEFVGSRSATMIKMFEAFVTTAKTHRATDDSALAVVVSVCQRLLNVFRENKTSSYVQQRQSISGLRARRRALRAKDQDRVIAALPTLPILSDALENKLCCCRQALSTLSAELLTLFTDVTAADDIQHTSTYFHKLRELLQSFVELGYLPRDTHLPTTPSTSVSCMNEGPPSVEACSKAQVVSAIREQESKIRALRKALHFSPPLEQLAQLEPSELVVLVERAASWIVHGSNRLDVAPFLLLTKCIEKLVLVNQHEALSKPLLVELVPTLMARLASHNSTLLTHPGSLNDDLLTQNEFRSAVFSALHSLAGARPQLVPSLIVANDARLGASFTATITMELVNGIKTVKRCQRVSFGRHHHLHGNFTKLACLLRFLKAIMANLSVTVAHALVCETSPISNSSVEKASTSRKFRSTGVLETVVSLLSHAVNLLKSNGGLNGEECIATDPEEEAEAVREVLCHPQDGVVPLTLDVLLALVKGATHPLDVTRIAIAENIGHPVMEALDIFFRMETEWPLHFNDWQTPVMLVSARCVHLLDALVEEPVELFNLRALCETLSFGQLATISNEAARLVFEKKLTMPPVISRSVTQQFREDIALKLFIVLRNLAAADSLLDRHGLRSDDVAAWWPSTANSYFAWMSKQVATIEVLVPTTSPDTLNSSSATEQEENGIKLVRLYFARVGNTSHHRITANRKEDIILTVNNSSADSVTRSHTFLHEAKRLARELDFHERLGLHPQIMVVLEVVVMLLAIGLNLTLLFNVEFDNGTEVGLTESGEKVFNEFAYVQMGLQIVLSLIFFASPFAFHVKETFRENRRLMPSTTTQRRFHHAFGVFMWWPLIFRLLFIASACLAIWHTPVWHGILAFQIVPQSRRLMNVVVSVSRNGVNLLSTGFLLCVVVYIYSLIAFYSYSHAFLDDLTGVGGNCKSLGRCAYLVLNFGLRSSGGIGDKMDYPSLDPHNPGSWYIRYAFDISFFILVCLLFVGIVFGTIIDTFAQLRNERDAAEAMLESQCFICGLPKSDFNDSADRMANRHQLLAAAEDNVSMDSDRSMKLMKHHGEARARAFHTHTETEHCAWDYVLYMHRLSTIPFTHQSYLQRHVSMCLAMNSARFLPVGRALSQEREELLD